MDRILYWNDVAMAAVAEDYRGGVQSPPQQKGPTATSRALAMIHIALHDAYFSLNGGVNRPEPYTAGLPAAPIVAPTALDVVTASALAGAALGTLNSLYSGQRAQFAEALGGAGLRRGEDPGWGYGQAVARRVLESRAGDKAEAAYQNAGEDAYAHSVQYGRHRHDPVAGALGEKSLHPRWGEVKLFGTAALQRQDAFPGFGTDDYLADPTYAAHHRQVRAKGGHPAMNTTTRTPDETLAGLCWAYDGAAKLGTPPRLYNQVVRLLAAKHGLTEAENARLFLLLNIAMADAGINAWHWKYVYDLWRPVVGIREADPSMGGATKAAGGIGADCDPAWIPLGAPNTNAADKADFTPPFPSYPSGHATFGAAAFQIARLFLRRKLGGTFGNREADNYGFAFVSDELNGRNTASGPGGRPRARHERRYDGLWAAMIENSLSRVYLGVHWRFDGYLTEAALADARGAVGGVPLGLAIAEEIWARLGWGG